MLEYIKKNLRMWNNNTNDIEWWNGRHWNKSLEDFGLLLNGVSEIIKNETKKHKEGFLSMLLGTLGASLLGNIVMVKAVNRAGEGFIRAGYGSSIKIKDFQYCLIL